VIASVKTCELAHHPVEVLVPDFRGRDDRALEILESRAARRDEPQPGNHSAFTKHARFDYQFSLNCSPVQGHVS
jgi:lipoate synthase